MSAIQKHSDEAQILGVAKPSDPKLTVLPPVVPKAKTERRHLGLVLSFILLVLMPIGLVGGYYYYRAIDQYASVVGFSVRTAEIASPIELLGGLANLSGSSSSDAEVLFAFLKSQELVDSLDQELDLREIYAGHPDDPLHGFNPDGVLEDLVDHWNRMTKIDFDSGTGLIELRVLAFSPQDAHLLATAALRESSDMINRLSDVARTDSTRYAQEELDAATVRLTDAREKLTAFRSRAQIVDPEADIQTQMGLLASLQEKLAEALISVNLLREVTGPNDNRIQLAERRIDIIQTQIDEERSKFGIGGQNIDQAPYAEVVAEFERLSIEREIAETAYATTLASFHAAQAEARRQSRYLAAHIRPTLAQKSEHPQRLDILLITTVLLFVGWAIAVLVFYSARDRR